MPDDFHRYIEHLQRQTLSEGWESAYDAESLKNWTRENSTRLREMARRNGLHNESSLVQQLERAVGDFQPATRFELPWTTEIFAPLLFNLQEGGHFVDIALDDLTYTIKAR